MDSTLANCVFEPENQQRNFAVNEQRHLIRFKAYAFRQRPHRGLEFSHSSGQFGNTINLTMFATPLDGARGGTRTPTLLGTGF